MPDFPHLVLSAILDGLYRPQKLIITKTVNPRTDSNLKKRSEHASFLSGRIEALQSSWASVIEERTNAGLPPLPDAIPLFLQIDPYDMPPDSLRSFGIEIISVEEDGFIIGASTDGFNFKSLKEKIELFVKKEGKFKDTASKLWEINSGQKWRIEQILSPELQNKWEDIQDQDVYFIDVSVSCNVYVSDAPVKNTSESEPDFNKRLIKWRSNKDIVEQQKDELAYKRERDLELLVKAYNGEFLSSVISSQDSFGVRIKIIGIGLKDLVLNFPFVFDVSEYDPYSISYDSVDSGISEELSFESPSESSPTICIVDSGIQEMHKYLMDAIRQNLSKSYLSDNNSTADEVENGGHGTRVAGCVLFSNEIPRNRTHKHIAWLANARILDDRNIIPSNLYPPVLFYNIVSDYKDQVKLFNLSLGSSRACRLKHMSDWAASLDQLNWEYDSLFVISAGNISRDFNHVNNPGLKDLISSGREYPSYFDLPFARITNPAQSAFSLTVGSICNNEFETLDLKSFGKLNEPSSFTRSGPGLWGMVKPDVVEYGGDYVREKNANPNITTRPDTCPETIRTTNSSLSARGNDVVGTSFSAPKVSHVAAHILNQWPDASSLFLRSLIVQSARWPEISLGLTEYQKLNLFGYGLVSLDRALDNSPNRITYVVENNISPKFAHVYKVDIPEELNRPGDSHQYLIEVSLAYKARIRRTRRGTKSYVSSWVDWMSSKRGESDEMFKRRAVQYASSVTGSFEIDTSDLDTDVIQWIFREKNNWGAIKGMKRNDSTLQKDWVYLKSHELPETLSFSVIGHPGWEKDIYQESIPYCFMISIECLNPEIQIYNKIRLHNQIEVEV